MEFVMKKRFQGFQNKMAKLKDNRTLVETVRSMISYSKLKKNFWAEAVATATYLRNRSPTSTLAYKKTPYEALYKKRPFVGHLKIFGCICYAHIPKEQRQKLDFKSSKCIFLGYASDTKGYKLYEIASGKIILSRDVIFSENVRITDKEIEVDKEDVIEYEISESSKDDILKKEYTDHSDQPIKSQEKA